MDNIEVSGMLGLLYRASSHFTFPSVIINPDVCVNHPSRVSRSLLGVSGCGLRDPSKSCYSFFACHPSGKASPDSCHTSLNDCGHTHICYRRDRMLLIWSELVHVHTKLGSNSPDPLSLWLNAVVSGTYSVLRLYVPPTTLSTSPIEACIWSA